jgi:hypothetical protein
MGTHEPGRLFSVAPSHLYVAAHYDWRAGWAVSVTSPAVEGHTTTAAVYEALSSSELLDVVAQELARRLALDTPPL